MQTEINQPSTQFLLAWRPRPHTAFMDCALHISRVTVDCTNEMRSLSCLGITYDGYYIIETIWIANEARCRQLVSICDAHT